MSLTEQPPPNVVPIRTQVQTEPVFVTGDVVECYVDTKTKERGRFLVTKINPTNVKLEDESGMPRSINRRGILGLSDDQAWSKQTVSFPRGTIVRFLDDRDREDRRGEFVVVKNTADGRHELVEVGGGSDDMSWRNVHSSTVEIVKGTITVR